MSTTASIRKALPGIWIAVVTALFLAGSIARVAGQSEQAGSDKGLEGTWRLQVAPYDCTTGAQLPPFPALVTYSTGGTSIGVNGGTHFQPGQRSPEFGTWTYTGAQSYRAVREAFILFSSPANPPVPPLPRGTQRIEETIEVDGEWFESLATSQLIIEGGTVVASVCARITGERMK